MTTPSPGGNRRRGPWWPVGGWLLVIVAITSVPAAMVPRGPQFPGIDKVIHFTMYGVLGVLSARARGNASPHPVLGSVALFALADEWHQRWIPGRGMSGWDWLADVLGAGVGYAVQRARRRQEQMS